MGGGGGGGGGVVQIYINTLVVTAIPIGTIFLPELENIETLCLPFY